MVQLLPHNITVAQVAAGAVMVIAILGDKRCVCVCVGGGGGHFHLNISLTTEVASQLV